MQPNEPATLRQRQLIDTLCKELDVEAPNKSLTYSEADGYIKKLIAAANGNGSTEKELKDYPFAFQAMIKAAAVLYANRTDKTFKDIVREVKEVFGK